MSLLVALLIGLVFAAPVVAAYVLVPGEVLDAWPAFGVTFLPVVAAMLALLLFRSYRPFLSATLPESAADWLRRTLDHMGKIGFTVAAMERGEAHHGNFFHPASRTIVLGDDVHGEHTARAYATAAHELGHALFHVDHPHLSRLFMVARGVADRCFNAGAGLLLGAVLVGGDGPLLAAFLLMVVAVVLHALVVADEAIASALANQILRNELPDDDQRRIARADLRVALATYASRLIAFLIPIALAPWWLPHLGDGLLHPDAPLTGLRATAATVLAVGCIVGAVAALLHVLFPFFGPLAGMRPMAAILARSWAPLLAVLLCTQSDLPAWAIALAVVPAWSILSAPAVAVLRRIGGFFGSDLDDQPLPFQSPRGTRILRISAKDLARKEAPESLADRALAYSFTLWIIPLAVMWLAR